MTYTIEDIKRQQLKIDPSFDNSGINYNNGFHEATGGYFQNDNGKWESYLIVSAEQRFYHDYCGCLGKIEYSELNDKQMIQSDKPIDFTSYCGCLGNKIFDSQ